MTNNNEQKKPATLDDVLLALEQNQQTLDDIKTWIKISGVEKVQNILSKFLETPEQRIVYHLSDGKTTREINSVCGVSIGTISRYWKMWYSLGIMKSVSVKGGGERHMKIFDLEDYGVEIPQIKKGTEQKSSEQNTTEQTKPDGDIT